jgi:hypothetical protein
MKTFNTKHCLTAAALFLVGPAAHATTFNVKQLGCGTEPDCFTTIAGAVTRAEDDDTLCGWRQGYYGTGILH